MARELRSLDARDVPGLLNIAKEIRDTGEARVIKDNGENLAIIAPAKPMRRTRRTGIVTEDDALFRLIGIGKSGIPGGVSGRKHEYLARAYRPQ